MNKILITTIVVAIFYQGICFSQDKVIKTNNEELSGKIILFQNGKFTLLLADKSEITFSKDVIKEIQFDTAKCSGISIAINSVKEEDMDPDCGKINIGNCVFINKTGVELTLVINKVGAEDNAKEFKLSKSEDTVKYYGLESGSYNWKTIYTFNTSGGFFIPKCKTASPVIIQ